MSRRVNPAALQELAGTMGVDPLVLERDWVLTEIVFHLAQTSGAHLVLKGGQALRHVYGSERFSKDVDYVARRRLEFEELRDRLNIRYPRLRTPGQPSGPTKFGLTIRPIAYVGPLNVRGTVEVEVSFREDIILPPVSLDYQSLFRDTFPVIVMNLTEMVAEKVRALYQRGNPRDLYDLWFVFSQLDQPIDGDAVARLVPAKFTLVSGGWKRQRLYDRIRANEADWQEGLRYLVAEQPAFDDALSTVEDALRVIIANVR